MLFILFYSKEIMGKFWYDVMAPTFGEDNIHLLYTGIKKYFFEQPPQLPQVLSSYIYIYIYIIYISDTDSYYVEFDDWSYEEVLSKLEPHIDFSNFPSTHPRFSNSRKAQFGFVKVDTAEAVIHAFIGEKKKSYQIFTNDTISEVADLFMERKARKKGVPSAAVTKVKDKQLLDLTCEPGLIHVEFNKLQTKSHSIKMIHQVKSLTNSFDNGSYYKNCGICTIPFNCNLENINECQSIDCDRIKLLVDIWRRELNEK